MERLREPPIWGKDKRGVQTKSPAGIRHGGERIREGALALLEVCILCELGSQASVKFFSI